MIAKVAVRLLLCLIHRLLNAINCLIQIIVSTYTDLRPVDKYTTSKWFGNIEVIPR